MMHDSVGTKTATHTALTIYWMLIRPLSHEPSHKHRCDTSLTTSQPSAALIFSTRPFLVACSNAAKVSAPRNLE